MQNSGSGHTGLYALQRKKDKKAVLSQGNHAMLQLLSLFTFKRHLKMHLFLTF